MDRGVVPLSAFVEVYVEVQDVNDNAPQTSEPVYYPSVMENSPKDVSIIKINAVDPDDKGSDKLTYRITSGNPQGFFAINVKTGKIAVATAAVHVTVNCLLRVSNLCCIPGEMPTLNMAALLRVYSLSNQVQSINNRSLLSCPETQVSHLTMSMKGKNHEIYVNNLGSVEISQLIDGFI